MPIKPIIILISGYSCSGKTILGRKIEKEFNIPLLSKDDIKERLFDTIGFKEGDVALSQKLGKASYDILFHISTTLVKSQISHILEAPFKADFVREWFLSLKEKYDCSIFRILLETGRDELLRRHKSRYLSGERHPGHFDDKLISEKNSLELMDDDFLPVDMDGEVYLLDTTDFDKIDYEKLFDSIRVILNSSKTIK